MLLKNITQLCKEKGITISRLERECGISNNSIRRWDKTSPSIKSVHRVALYLGTTVDALLSDSGDDVRVKKWYDIKGVVVIEKRLDMKSIGFQDLKEFIRILKDHNITENDEIHVHIQRGDGADF